MFMKYIRNDDITPSEVRTLSTWVSKGNPISLDRTNPARPIVPSPVELTSTSFKRVRLLLSK